MNPAPPSAGDVLTANGSPVLSAETSQGANWYSMEDYGYNDDGDMGGNNGDTTEDGQRDAKRRRIARACDMCRKKKIKCDGRMPKCSHCENYKTECIFTQVEKKRAPPKGAKYIEGLENRLGRMESLLRLSGLLAEDDDRTDLGTLEKRLQERSQPQGPNGTRSDATSPQSQDSAPRPIDRDTSASHAGTPQEARVTSPASANNSNVTTKNNAPDPPAQAAARNPKEVDALADQMCSLITNHSGETRYIGSSSGFSIFSPKGIQWVNTKTGDNSFEEMIASAAANEQKWDHWRPEVFDDIFGRRVFKPLPSKHECYSLLKDFFANFNCMFPLFHEPTFMHLVEKHYSLDPYEGSGWWASLNVALAIAHRLRVMSNVVDHGEDEQAWGYLKNAMAVMTELTMRNTDLLSVQALLGMSLFLQGTPNPQPSFFLVAAATRLSHSIGLHKRGSGFNLNEVESEQRKRVFWIAYLLDKDICLRSGRPPAQDDDDMNVDLPSEDPPDNIGNVPLSRETADGKTTMNLFRHMCTFAQIQSRVYKQLYSVRASRQSDGELLNTIGELDQALEEWKDGIPIDFRPEHELRANHTALIVHVVVLHFAYYNCLTTIHRMSVHHGYWTRGLGDYALQGLNARPLNPRVFMSAALCVNAARTSIGLVRYIPQGDYACVWLILYYPVSSLVTLFANILQNPHDTRARSDLKLMSSVVSFLTMLEHDAREANGSVGRMLSVCAEFERIAKVVLDKSEREMRGRGKRKQAEREKERDRANGTISAEIDDGKTLEQLQLETQASYRKPVQTPSMRAASMSGSGSGASPGSWGGSPGKVDRASHQFNSNGQPASLSSMAQATAAGRQARSSPFSAMPQNHPGTPLMPAFDASLAELPQGAGAAGPTSFAHPQQAYMDGFGVSAAAAAAAAAMNAPGINYPLSQVSQTYASPDMGAGTGTGEAFSGPFQQPFVPQDLWQMPMTLEWDWAEGLGLGSFTPGPIMNDESFGMGGQHGM